MVRSISSGGIANVKPLLPNILFNVTGWADKVKEMPLLGEVTFRQYSKPEMSLPLFRMVHELGLLLQPQIRLDIRKTACLQPICRPLYPHRKAVAHHSLALFLPPCHATWHHVKMSTAGYEA